VSGRSFIYITKRIGPSTEPEDDKEILQDDFTKQEEWSGKWLLKFHPEKCKHMKISKSKNEETNSYKLLGQDIETVTQEKDIGVIIDFPSYSSVS
jgi:hypothetical protein